MHFQHEMCTKPKTVSRPPHSYHLTIASGIILSENKKCIKGIKGPVLGVGQNYFTLLSCLLKQYLR